MKEWYKTLFDSEDTKFCICSLPGGKKGGEWDFLLISKGPVDSAIVVDGVILEIKDWTDHWYSFTWPVF